MPGINEDTIERQELHCHACGKYVQFDLDTSVNGNYVLNCPNCGHEHCRVVNNGKISDVRWDQRNGNGTGNNLPTWYISSATVTYSTASSATTTSVNVYLYGATAGTGTGWY